ncbi:unnamed protein product [Rhizoctonia solani]|uniref:Uncharacterized protein n=1 Tax=Rhizoctonia solani TaxID=456999 RepID=A0A8H2Y480_9AGAM|nr:unnamed protein product [Rhizoctonia solani]
MTTMKPGWIIRIRIATGPWKERRRCIEIIIQLDQKIVEQPVNLSPQELGDQGYAGSSQYLDCLGVGKGPEDRESDSRTYAISTTALGQARFPPEIWHLIIMHATTALSDESEDSSKYISNKVRMNSLWNLANVSKMHRQLVLRYWADTMHLLEQSDPWDLSVLGTSNEIDLLLRVRRLVCENGYQVYRAPKNAFEGFKFLEELILNCHSDINFGEDIQPHNAHEPQEGESDGQLATQDNPDGAHQPNMIIQPARMSYRRLRVELPSTLRRLRVYDSHVPDIYFIQQVVEQCPLLQSLTLARCTIFSRHGCDFWRRLPSTESDAYFSNQGVSAYAAAIGRELKQVQSLKELRIGIYLTNHAAIDEHLSQHAALTSTPDTDLRIWEKSCKDCVAQHYESTLAAEREATEILGKQVPTLLSVSWANFCSERRTGWSTHRIRRDKEGTFEGLADVANLIDSGKHVTGDRMNSQ